MINLLFRGNHYRVFMFKYSTGLGKRIYEYTGHGAAIKDWEGWDGKINGRSDASPGMYYYIIRAVGYDDISYKGKEYTGVLYLFREK